MLTAIVISLSLVVVTSLFHYEVLRVTSDVVPRLRLPSRARVSGIIFVVLVAHLVEMFFYAAAFYVSVRYLQLGEFRGVMVEGFLDYLYFSSVTYTSLGLGDVFPVGHLRFLTGVEALNGLVLIAWTGAFTYLAMGKMWPWDACHPIDYGSTMSAVSRSSSSRPRGI